MNVIGQVVRVALSNDGHKELSGVFVDEGQGLEVLVIDQDDRGLWVFQPEQASEVEIAPLVRLLKWNYFSTLEFEFRPAPPDQRSRVGFK